MSAYRSDPASPKIARIGPGPSNLRGGSRYAVKSGWPAVGRDHPNECMEPLKQPAERPKSQMQFLVDDGVACPPDYGLAGRNGLPVRNNAGQMRADRRLAQRTGELGAVQV